MKIVIYYNFLYKLFTNEERTFLFILNNKHEIIRLIVSRLDLKNYSLFYCTYLF